MLLRRDSVLHRRAPRRRRRPPRRRRRPRRARSRPSSARPPRPRPRGARPRAPRPRPPPPPRPPRAPRPWRAAARRTPAAAAGLCRASTEVRSPHPLHCLFLARNAPAEHRTLTGPSPACIGRRMRAWHSSERRPRLQPRCGPQGSACKGGPGSARCAWRRARYAPPDPPRGPPAGRRARARAGPRRRRQPRRLAPAPGSLHRGPARASSASGRAQQGASIRRQPVTRSVNAQL